MVTIDDTSRGSGAAWHATDAPAVAASTGTDPARGLPAGEAAARLEREGPNELRKGAAMAPLAIFAGQFQSVVIWVLIGAAVVSVALGERVDGIAIVAIVLLNAIIGFIQEFRAERAVAALARLAAPRARVIRDGHAAVVAAAEVVRGDLLLLEAGDIVAADARLLGAANLRTNEAPLTGESAPVEKQVAACGADTPLAERASMVFFGTAVASGSGQAVVVATGMATEVGHIAALLESASSGETPLQQKLDQVGRRLLAASLAIVGVVFGLGLLRGVPALEMFLAAVSLAVAAIPEGLPAVVTVTLALGVQRMVRRNALVRRLPSVETLGCAQIICTDKTGTLTVGEMTARKLVTIDRTFGVTGEGYGTAGGFVTDGQPCGAEPEPHLDALLRGAVACCDAELEIPAGDGIPTVVGDPTEGALLVAAAKGGITRAGLEDELPRLGVIPFDSERKRMTVIRRRNGGAWAFAKGAPEVILSRCTGVRAGTDVVALTEPARERMLEASALLANDALRVLAIAERPLDDFPASDDAIECELIFLGLVGLQDPPRAEAREAVARCRRAGIGTVMITGDHPDTARAIARELAILDDGDTVLIGRELDAMSDERLAEHVRATRVYARVTAEHKLRIVRAWKAHGAVVAMTGDGVNDAPALKEASIGIAMGIAGTEVTKEAADMVITDDNFASIVAAVEEGRGIYDNIAKTLGYLLAGNAGELAVVLVATLVGWPLPLLPLQLLWINLVTDGLPALALATDPIDADVLARPPRRSDSEIMDRDFILRIVLTGCLTATVTLAAFAYEWYGHGDLAGARSAAFTVLVIDELVRSFGARSNVRTAWEVGLFSNMSLVVTVAVSLLLQLALLQTPALQGLFDTTPIDLAELGIWALLGMTPLAVLEARKLVLRRIAAPRDPAQHSLSNAEPEAWVLGERRLR